MSNHKGFYQNSSDEGDVMEQDITVLLSQVFTVSI